MAATGICGDEDGGTLLYRVHDVRKGPDNLIYVGETDVPHRSGYLWECELEM